jgi:hypothetical protein
MNDTTLNELIDIFNHKTNVVWKPNLNFIKDINIILGELKLYHSYINLDIYEVLVSCGHNITWDREYYISEEDIDWFKNDEGKKYILNILNENEVINTMNEYNAIIHIHSKLIDLFELCKEN